MTPHFPTVQQRIRDSKPGGQSYEEQAGSLGKFQLQLRASLPFVGLDEFGKNLHSQAFAGIVPLLQKTQKAADCSLLLYRSHVPPVPTLTARYRKWGTTMFRTTCTMFRTSEWVMAGTAAHKQSPY